MSERDRSDPAALLEEWSESDLQELLRAEWDRAGGPPDPDAALRIVSLAVLRKSLPATGLQTELPPLVDELLPLLMAHEQTRSRMERLVGLLSKEGRATT